MTTEQKHHLHMDRQPGPETTDTHFHFHTQHTDSPSAADSLIILSSSSLCGSHHPSRVFRNALTSTSSLRSALLPDVRQQLNEQLRCLDLRIETQVAIVQELQDYFRRRAEVELDYSKSLDKLGKSIQQRHKEQKQK